MQTVDLCPCLYALDFSWICSWLCCQGRIFHHLLLIWRSWKVISFPQQRSAREKGPLERETSKTSWELKRVLFSFEECQHGDGHLATWSNVAQLGFQSRETMSPCDPTENLKPQDRLPEQRQSTSNGKTSNEKIGFTKAMANASRHVDNTHTEEKARADCWALLFTDVNQMFKLL